ncbi:hypothetical protein [Moorena sp. SIO3I8]|uniref:hypothetical protein n=1 Tax=Moorena sp. SIO3I8 TaxID=2607833 RepID=UPI0013C252F6|nr:hypothetical protein [Moorena sp. SIO3I8]NEO10279.1 hypothetical protein [Moorena sp. SIO3I8]
MKQILPTIVIIFITIRCDMDCVMPPRIGNFRRCIGLLPRGFIHRIEEEMKYQKYAIAFGVSRVDSRSA